MKYFAFQLIGLLSTLALVSLALWSVGRLLWAFRTQGRYNQLDRCWPERSFWWMTGASGVVGLWSSTVLGGRLAPDTWLWFFILVWTAIWVIVSSWGTRQVWRMFDTSPQWHRNCWALAVFTAMAGVMTVLATKWTLLVLAAALAAVPWLYETWHGWFTQLQLQQQRRLTAAAGGCGVLLLLAVGIFIGFFGHEGLQAILTKTKVGQRVEEAVVPPPPPPKEAAVKLPRWIIGKGLWIVDLDKTEGGDLAAIVKKAKKYRADCLIVKLFDSEYAAGPWWLPFEQDGVKYDIQEKAKELVALAHAQDLRIYAWGYVYGLHPDREISLARESLLLGVDGFIYDAEGQYKGRGAAAEAVASAVRQWRDKYHPEQLLGFSSFDGTLVHGNKGFPYAAFDRHCEVFLPQTYWKDDADGTPANRISWASAQWEVSAELYHGQGAGGSFDHILPTGHAYDPKIRSDLREIPYAEVLDFMEETEKFWGVSIYTMEYMGPAQLQAFRDGPGSRAEKAERYRKQLEEKRRKKAAEAKAAAAKKR